MKHKIIGYIIAALLLSLGVFVMKQMISSKKEPEKREVIPVVKLIKTLNVQLTDVAVQIPISGKLESFNKIELFSEVGGKMLKGSRNFKEGVTFRKAEVLFQLDSRDVKAALVAQRSGFLTVLTQISPDIKLDYSTNYNVWKAYIQNFDPEKTIQELPKTKTAQEKNFLIAKNVLNLFYNIKSQELKLSKFTVLAPFNGVLSLSTTQYGSIIRPGQKLGEFIQPNIFELEAPVNVKDVNYLKKGQKVKLISNDINGDWTGSIARIGRNIDSKTQSVMIYIAVNGQNIKEGMYLNGKIDSDIIPNSLEIPRKLLNDDKSIFAVQEQKLIKVFPKVEKVNESTIIISGLEKESLLLAEPFVGAYQGLSVQITN